MNTRWAPARRELAALSLLAKRPAPKPGDLLPVQRVTPPDEVRAGVAPHSGYCVRRPALVFVVNPLRHRGGPIGFSGSAELVTNVS
jgi:hypothetical protein